MLLKVYQVKGPTEHYYSKFKNDNWAMDGYVRHLSFLFYCILVYKYLCIYKVHTKYQLHRFLEQCIHSITESGSKALTGALFNR